MCTFETSLVLLRIPLLLRGSVEINAAARAILQRMEKTLAVD
jgi:hypothetical protein